MIEETVGTIQFGQVTVSSSVKTPLTTAVLKPQRGVRLKALAANGGIVYVGGCDVSSSSWPLDPGGELFLPLNVANTTWLLAAHNGDTVAFLYI